MPYKHVNRLNQVVVNHSVLEERCDFLAEEQLLVGFLVLKFYSIVNYYFQTHDLHSLHVVELSVRDKFQEVYQFLVADERRFLNNVRLQK